MEDNKDAHNNSNDVIYNFDLDPLLMDLDMVKHIGIEKSSNCLIVEVNNQTVTQEIDIRHFSKKTIIPLKKQLSEILVEYKDKEGKQKIVNSIVTCINKNINIISQYSKENSNTKKDDEKDEESKKIDILINLALNSENIQNIFKDQVGMVHAAIRLGKDKHLAILSVDSIKFKRYLSKLFRDNTGFSIGDTSINNAISTLAAEAEFNGDTIPLHLKVAIGSGENGAKSNCIYYDMCDNQGRVIEISKDGWRIIDGSDKDIPIFFKRFNQHPQVEPDRHYPPDIVDKLLNLTNVKNQKHRHLIIVYIISTLIPEIDHPILTTYGPKGSAKSFLLELIKKLIDPTKPTLLTLHRNVDQFIQQVNHNYINYYDNVKFIPYWLSDEICKAVTGAGHTKRVHYTNDDDFVYEHRRCLGLNGINVALTEADALDRSISIELEDIDEDKRRKESDLWAEFEKIKPQAFAYILDVIVKAIRIKETLNLKNLPRMADFTEWGEAISQAMGYPPMSFVDVYKENRNEQNIVAINENLVSSLLLKYILEFEPENGSTIQMQYGTQELYKEVIEYAEENNIKIDYRHFPNNASSFVKKIKTVIPNFKAGYGIIINIGRNSKDNTSIITISRKTVGDKSSISEDNGNTSAGGTESPEPIFTKNIEDNIIDDTDYSDSSSIDNNTEYSGNSSNNSDSRGDNIG
jgi:hypothetical protein